MREKGRGHCGLRGICARIEHTCAIGGNLQNPDGAAENAGMHFTVKRALRKNAWNARSPRAPNYFGESRI